MTTGVTQASGITAVPGSGGGGITTLTSNGGTISITNPGGPTTNIEAVSAPATVALGVSGAGTTQGTATALTSTWNQVTTCAAGAGVLLPVKGAGLSAMVTNVSPNNCIVYPPVGYAFNNGTVNAGMSLGTISTTLFRFLSATQIAF